jgi:argininosuccinate lyase
MKTLWGKGISTDKLIEDFTVGKDRELDLLLAPYDVLGSMAHAIMLKTVGLVNNAELKEILKELREIYSKAIAGDLVIEDGVEDIHSQVELLLTQKLGDAGKKIHTGRSRNDQVAVDIKLYLRNEIFEITELTKNLFDRLQILSEQYKDTLLPGYTHFQIAMPSSFGLWFGAYAESLVDDLIQLQASYQVVNKNPLGSGAGYGSTFPLNRTLTTKLLGFRTLNYNVVYAQMGRGRAEKVLSNSIASLASSIGRLSMDVCLYMSQNMSFITFPDNLTTGSSIMPHKKNPDVFELLRARCNKLQALPNDLLLILNNLPSGYHRDMQLLKEILFPAIEEIKTCLRITEYMLQNIIVNKNILDDNKYDYLFSVEAVHELVKKGYSFRDAYKEVGKQIGEGTYKPVKELFYTHEGSIGNLCNDEIKRNFDKVYRSFGFEKAEKAIKGLLKI